jgi:hypothetical protein
MPVCAEVGQEQAPTSPIELPQVGRRTQIAPVFSVSFRSLVSIVPFVSIDSAPQLVRRCVQC